MTDSDDVWVVTFAVARAIEDRGYDRLDGAQLVELQRHLTHFLHGEPGVYCPGGVR